MGGDRTGGECCGVQQIVKIDPRSRDQDRDLDKMNSSALESRDDGLEITSLAFAQNNVNCTTASRLIFH